MPDQYIAAACIGQLTGSDLARHGPLHGLSRTGLRADRNILSFQTDKHPRDMQG
ncbi:hypothetical protein D3C81_2292830 [compost metagenome]